MPSGIRILITTLLLAGTVSAAYAQNTASASIAAAIVIPIAITKTADLDFGNVAVHAVNPGTVTLSPAGQKSASGGVTIPANSGNFMAAAFTVSGEDGSTYAVTLPASPVVLQSGAGTMTVSGFSSIPAASGTLSGGSQTLQVGATLVVDGGQAPGQYLSTAPFAITVNYN